VYIFYPPYRILSTSLWVLKNRDPKKHPKKQGELFTGYCGRSKKARFRGGGSAPAAPIPDAAPKAPAAPVIAAGAEEILAPLPGTVISVNVAVGDQVKAGQILFIFEAMKMENELVAHRNGTVVKTHVQKGDLLESSKPVITIT